MKRLIGIAISLAMLLSISSVFALPISAEGIEENTSEATAVPADSSKPILGTVDSTEGGANPLPEVTEPDSNGKTAITTEQPDESQPDVSSDADISDNGIFDNGEPIEPPHRAEFSVGEINNDELFEQYLTKLLYGNTETIPLASSWGRAQLSGNDLKLYDELKPHIIAIAEGRETSTTINISPSTTANYDILGRVILAIYTDMPYEMYWMDVYTIGYLCVQQYGQSFVEFDVAEGYHTSKTNQYGMHTEVDTSKITRAKNAANNARRICSEASGSDYDKIKYLASEICRLADYDYNAYNESLNDTITDIAPWMLINVFDDDTGTNVVCEGFAKSFQYLCELAGIESYCVTGYMDGGLHMWNLVRLNGKMHVLDVTACEGGFDLDEFVYGASLTSDGYKAAGTTYVYEKSMFDIYSRSILFPAEPDGEIIKSGYCGAEGSGTNLKWEFDDLGTLTISGYGDMADYSYEYSGGSEWRVSRFLSEAVKNVVIEEGVTSIGDSAFYYMQSINNVSLPSTLTSIGDYAFSYAGIETVNIPKGVTSVGMSIFGWSLDANIKEIYCEAKVKPSGWNANWNGTGATVYWAGIPLIDSGYCGGEGDGTNLCWTLDTSGVLTVSGQGSMKDYNGYWGIPWDKHIESIRSVIISNGVTSIGDWAFCNCTNLTGVTIAKSVTSIGEYAFCNCESLKSVTIPGNVTSVDVNVFYDCTALAEINCEAAGKPDGWDNNWVGKPNVAVNWNADIPEHTPGDVNNDGEVDISDAIRLIRYLTDDTIEVNASAVDANGDGEVDISDAIRLIRYLTDDSVEIY